LFSFSAFETSLINPTALELPRNAGLFSADGSFSTLREVMLVSGLSAFLVALFLGNLLDEICGDTPEALLIKVVLIWDCIDSSDRATWVELFSVGH